MVETAEAKQVCRAASTLVYPALDFDRKPCGTYTREDFEQVLSRIAFDQEFANTGGKTVQLDRSEPVDVTSTARNPLAKSLLYHLRQLDADAINSQFDGVRDRLFQTLRSLRLLPPRVDVAIDLHEWRFYSQSTQTTSSSPTLISERTERTALRRYVSSLRAFDSRSLCSRWMRTASVRSVRSLILEARRYVSIRHVYLDRGFYQVHVVKELDRLDANFIVRARPSTGMKARLSAGAETVVDASQMQRKRPPTASVDVTVFAVPHRTSEDEHVWFVTNLDVESGTARAYAAAFRRRWGIETSYRQIGDFLPRTSSPTFSVRLFYFLFAVALYNLWVLANVLVSGGSILRKPQISTRIFRTLVIPQGYG
ncbi:transposase [Halobacterium salinarum]|uniref:transposase n=1 Tax=Halobacterium salinarum TaxID=2242 RepID=UPI00255623B9|nr:transposase [Halobacterium salinarum]MDL0124171.1 transposase [Halobacterium salinarum]MDL0126534.1 transposase [Halobacterium salinarum]